MANGVRKVVLMIELDDGSQYFKEVELEGISYHLDDKEGQKVTIVGRVISTDLISSTDSD